MSGPGARRCHVRAGRAAGLPGLSPYRDSLCGPPNARNRDRATSGLGEACPCLLYVCMHGTCVFTMYVWDVCIHVYLWMCAYVSLLCSCEYVCVLSGPCVFLCVVCICVGCVRVGVCGWTGRRSLSWFVTLDPAQPSPAEPPVLSKKPRASSQIAGWSSFPDRLG